MVTFCYVFVVLALLVTVMPLALVLLMPTTSAHGAYRKMAQSPIGIVLGCVHAAKNEMWELACTGDRYRYEWMLKIGGSAFMVQDFEASPSPTPEAAATSTPAPTPTPKPTPSPTPRGETSDSNEYRERNLDFYTRWPPVVVHGGVSVPWYVLMISVMGGAVGMARRVPEYQRRALDPSDESLSSAKAREDLVFEIVQVASAPLIAITAYNVLAPESRAATVGLAFASGFSSEAILLAIRAATDRLIGPETKPPPTSQSKPPVDWLNRVNRELGEAAILALKGEGPHWGSASSVSGNPSSTASTPMGAPPTQAQT